MLSEKARRLTHGYRNFNNYRLRMLLAASGHPDPQDGLTTLESEEPAGSGGQCNSSLSLREGVMNPRVLRDRLLRRCAISSSCS